MVFQGHLSNFKVTQDKKSPILTQIELLRTVTPIIFQVIHQISRSHGLKNQRSKSNLSKITRPAAAIKSLRFVLLQRPLAVPWIPPAVGTVPGLCECVSGILSFEIWCSPSMRCHWLPDDYASFLEVNQAQKGFLLVLSTLLSHVFESRMLNVKYKLCLRFCYTFLSKVN